MSTSSNHMSLVASGFDSCSSLSVSWETLTSTTEPGAPKTTSLSLLATWFVRSFLTPLATEGARTIRNILSFRIVIQKGASSVVGASITLRL